MSGSTLSAGSANVESRAVFACLDRRFDFRADFRVGFDSQAILQGRGGLRNSVTPQRPRASSADQWFDYLRRAFRNSSGGGLGLYSKPLRSARYTSIGKSHKLGPAYGDNYYREKDLWAGRTKSGKRVKGEIVMDVFVVDAFSGSCGQRFQIRGAPARGNAASIRTLRQVQSTITQRNL